MVGLFCCTISTFKCIISTGLEGTEMREISLSLYQREFLTYRIINGYYTYNGLKICYPSIECLYEAQARYNLAYDEAIAQEVITESELLEIMYQLNEWSEYEENQLTILPKHIEEFQKQIYDNFESKKTLNQIFLYIDKAREELIKLLNKKAMFNYLTAEGLGLYAKIQYVVENSVYENDRLCDWDKYNLNELIYEYNTNVIEDKILRYLARNYPWSDFWAVDRNNGNLLGKPSCQYSDDQRRIVGWSLLYDNLRENPDCPSDEVIECDDALDGWLLIQREKRDRESNLDQAERKYGNKAGDLFIPVESQEQAQKIYDLNTPMARAVVKSRLGQIEKHGEIDESDLLDVKQQIGIKKTNIEMGRD